MVRRRIILIGIIATCIAILVASLTGLWRKPTKRTATKKEPRVIQRTGKGRARKATELIVNNLRHPEYDKQGNKIYELKSEQAREIGGNRLEILQPVIEVIDVKGIDEEQPRTIIIRAKQGKWDRKSKDAFLDKEVVAEVDEKTRISTESVSWIPSQRKVLTDKGITLISEQISMTGIGFEADMRKGIARLKDKVHVEVKGPEGFGFMREEKARLKKEPDEPIIITCKGELLFERLERRGTFFDDVNVVKGTSSLKTDKLEIVVNKEEKTAEKITASGHVNFKSEEISGSADTMVWKAAAEPGKAEEGKPVEEEDTIELVGEPGACVRHGKNELVAPQIWISQKTNKMTAQGSGHIVAYTKAAMTPDKKPTADKERKITVTWKRDMMYLENEAVFTGAVKLTEEDGMTLEADRLLARFAADEGKRMTGSVSWVQAKGDVVVKDGDRVANGQTLEWDVEGKTGVLEGAPNAEVREGNNFIVAEKIRFIQPGEKILVQGPGLLVGEHKNEQGALEKINISWKEGMSYDSQAHQAVFSKDVEAARGSMAIRAQQLRVLFDDDNKEVRKVVAQQKVTIEDGDRRGTGSEAEWDAATGLAVLKGTDPLATLSQEDNQTISAKKICMRRDTEEVATEGGGELTFLSREKKDEKEKAEEEKVHVAWKGGMRFNSAEHSAVFQKDVVAKKGDRQVRCNELQVSFDDANREVDTVVALGNVRLQEGEREGRGNKFTWSASENFVLLEGKPNAELSGEQGFRLLAAQIYQYQDKDEMQAKGAGKLEFKNPKRAGRNITIEWSRQMAFLNQQGLAKFLGDVKVETEDRAPEPEEPGKEPKAYVIQSQRLEILVDTQQELKEIRAYEDILMYDKQANQEATGQKLVWKSADDVAVLTGDPTANLYYNGRRQSSEQWLFTGFFGEKERTVVGKGQVSFTVPPK